MHVKAMILGAVAVLGATVGAQAQTILDARDVDAIMDIARAYGTTSMETQDDNGHPMIAVSTPTFTYYVKLRNCDASHANCEDINFYAGFANVKPTLDAINSWNMEWRFGNAYLDQDLDAVIEYDLNLVYGVTRDNLDAAFALWGELVTEYVSYIGYKPA